MSDSISKKERVVLPVPFLLESESSSATVKHKEQPIQAPKMVVRGRRLTSTRNYKLYQGKTIFFCGGRFLTSRSFWAFCVSSFLLIFPSVLFFIFTCPWLWHHVSPAVPIIFAYLFSLTLASMLKTSWTDPGIIPRNLEDSYPEDRYPLPKEVLYKGAYMELKYCDTCCIYRPPRASHCRQCDNCVGRK